MLFILLEKFANQLHTYWLLSPYVDAPHTNYAAIYRENNKKIFQNINCVVLVSSLLNI